MTSPLPPRLRDTRSLEDRVRQDRNNLKQLGVGFVGGRYVLARPLGSTAQFGDVEDDSAGDVDTAEIAACNTDRAVATSAGLIRLNLTHVPMDGTLHIRWSGVDQEPSEWSQSGTTVTFVNPRVKVDDVLTSAYLYYPSDDPVNELPTWESTGPNLIVPEGNMTNYSALGLDTSSWTIAAAPVGGLAGPNPGQPSWPPPALVHDPNAGFWLRRTAILAAAGTVNVSARVDGQWWLYVDGALIGSNSSPTGDLAQVGPFAVSLSEGEHLVVLHVNDEPGFEPPYPGEYTYADLNVELA